MVDAISSCGLSFGEASDTDTASQRCKSLAFIFHLSSWPFQVRESAMAFRKTEYKITVLGSGGVGKTGANV
jgi:hypothetical protein